MSVIESKLQVKGHVLIKDADTGEVLVDQNNAIHWENMSLAIAQSLARQSLSGPIRALVFGNGAASLSGVGTITYLTPNTTGSIATLYNQTYSKIVNDQDSNNSDPLKNNIVASHTNGALFTDIIISCTLETGEPSGQAALDNSTSLAAPYIFNEMGIESYSGALLAHIVFAPVEKSTNRRFAITYTIRVQMI